MRINNQTNSYNMPKTNFTSKIPVVVVSKIQLPNGKTITRLATMDSNIKTFLNKFKKILYGEEKTLVKNSDEIISRFKKHVPDHGLENGPKIRSTAKRGTAGIFTGEDARQFNDLGEEYGRALYSEAPNSESEFEVSRDSFINFVKGKNFETILDGDNEPKPAKMIIYTNGKVEVKDGQPIYNFIIENAFFEHLNKKLSGSKVNFHHNYNGSVIKAKAASKPMNFLPVQSPNMEVESIERPSEAILTPDINTGSTKPAQVSFLDFDPDFKQESNKYDLSGKTKKNSIRRKVV